MDFGLTDNVIERIRKVFENEPKIETVVIFGSRAYGNYREGSDIDFAIKGNEITHDDVLTIRGNLDDLNLPYFIDILDYSTIKGRDMKEQIDRRGKIFYLREVNL